MRLKEVDIKEKRRLILAAAKAAGLSSAVEEMIEDGLLDLSPERSKKKEERVAPRRESKIGDIYTANYDFTNIGATIYGGDVLVVLEVGVDLEIGVAKSIDGAKSRALIDRWSLEEYALIANCTKYVEPGEEPKVATSVRRDAPTRRMSQEQFRVALSEH